MPVDTPRRLRQGLRPGVHGGDPEGAVHQGDPAVHPLEKNLGTYVMEAVAAQSHLPAEDGTILQDRSALDEPGGFLPEYPLEKTEIQKQQEVSTVDKNYAEIEKGEDLVRVNATEFKGRQYIEIRTYYMAEDGEWKPTRKGITLSPEMMGRVHEALGRALSDVSAGQG
jgi:hypothetical protein